MDGEIFELLVGYLPESWTGGIGLAVAVCAAIAAIWPKPGQEAHPFWKGLYSLVNYMGLNIGYAKNMPRQKRTAAASALQSAAKAGIGKFLAKIGGRDGR